MIRLAGSLVCKLVKVASITLQNTSVLLVIVLVELDGMERLDETTVVGGLGTTLIPICACTAL